MHGVMIFNTASSSPREAAFAITGRDGPCDEEIPFDHPQVVILKELARTGRRGWRDPKGYETCRFAALMILFAEYAPRRVRDTVSALVYEELGEVADTGEASG